MNLTFLFFETYVKCLYIKMLLYLLHNKTKQRYNKRQHIEEMNVVCYKHSSFYNRPLNMSSMLRFHAREF